MWQDIANAVMADTVYSDSVLVAKDVSVTLPAVTFLTTEVSAMGSMDVVLPGLLDKMETAITKIGVDVGLGRMLQPQKHSFEFRWAQNVLTADGTNKTVGCKAFITGVPKGVPAVSLEIGSNIENEVSISTSRYQLFADGNEICCIDKLAQICRINGVDYSEKIASVL